MTQLRQATLNKINDVLDHSYFTKDSFTVTNRPDMSPFLTVTFIPSPEFSYDVYASTGKEEFFSREAPGEHMSTSEDFPRKDFSDVISGIVRWTNRIREDFKTRMPRSDDADIFLQQLREQIFSGADTEGEFSSEEVEELKQKLDALTRLVSEHAEKLEANDYQIRRFESEITEIKNDLGVMPKGVWHKVAGNKLLKSVGTFLKSGEGRQLLADGIKKLLGF